MKKDVYLDTTIPSYFFDDRDSLKYPIGIPEIITPLELFSEEWNAN